MAILAFGRWFVQGGVGFDGYQEIIGTGANCLNPRVSVLIVLTASEDIYFPCFSGLSITWVEEDAGM